MVTLPRAEPVKQNIETGVPADETTAKAKKKQPNDFIVYVIAVGCRADCRCQLQQLFRRDTAL